MLVEDLGRGAPSEDLAWSVVEGGSDGLEAAARIAKSIDRVTSVVTREIARNSTKTRGYRMVTADVAGRLQLEATHDTVELMKGSTPAEGKTASHEAIYQFIYAMPRGELARTGSSCAAGKSSAARLKLQVSAVPRSSGWSPLMSVTRTRATGGCPGTGKGT